MSLFVLTCMCKCGPASLLMMEASVGKGANDAHSLKLRLPDPM